MNVVIVGGGIIGCATAWELARQGCTVTVLERATPGAESSGAAAGLLAPLGEATGSPFEALALASWRLYPSTVAELRDRTGLDVEYVTHGTIYPVHDADGVHDAARRAKQPAAGELGIEAWSESDVREQEPALARVLGALFVRGDHWVNNQRLVMAYAQAAVGTGVTLRSGTAVSSLVVEGTRARGVVADGERVDADAVLLAAGAWTSALTATLGAPLPVEPKRGQMLALGHVPPVLRHCVHAHDVYLVPRPSGELLVGATVEQVGFRREVTAQGVHALLAAAIGAVPALGGLPISRTWYGFRPWAPDGLPVLGPWPGVEGLFVATAHFRNGILLAPITARLMSEWMTTGRPSIEVDAFLPDRFVRRTRSTS
jgi:glycine oxidase